MDREVRTIFKRQHTKEHDEKFLEWLDSIYTAESLEIDPAKPHKLENVDASATSATQD